MAENDLNENKTINSVYFKQIDDFVKLSNKKENVLFRDISNIFIVTFFVCFLIHFFHKPTHLELE